MDDPTVANQFEPIGAGSAQLAAGPVKTVCIEKQADGTFKVGLEEPEAESMTTGGGADLEGMEGMPPEAPEDNTKPAASIDEALDMARQILEGDDAGGMTVEQAFQGGFEGMPEKSGY